VNKITRFIYNFVGKVGRADQISNAHTLEFAYKHNGSGKEAFGGAEKWPYVRLEVCFQEGEEQKAWVFSRKLINIVDDLQQELGSPTKRNSVGGNMHPDQLYVNQGENLPTLSIWRNREDPWLWRVTEQYNQSTAGFDIEVSDINELILHTFFSEVDDE
jgi:hypothetical protein